MSYPTKGAPREATLSWDLFNEAAPFLRTFVYPFDDPPQQYFFVQGEEDYRWTGEPGAPPAAIETAPPPPAAARLGVPVMTIAGTVASVVLLRRAGRDADRRRRALRLLAAAGVWIAGLIAWPTLVWETENPFRRPDPVSEAEARRLFAGLHKNVYRAFDYADEDEIYDALAKSARGALLTDLYVRIRQGLRAQEQGGAVARVRDVSLTDGRVIPLEGRLRRRQDRYFRYQGEWTVSGSIEHWGHIHERVNRYAAVFDVEAFEDGWKIVAFQVTDEERVSARTDVREL